jgi:hypothetical protein
LTTRRRIPGIRKLQGTRAHETRKLLPRTFDVLRRFCLVGRSSEEPRRKPALLYNTAAERFVEQQREREILSYVWKG